MVNENSDYWKKKFEETERELEEFRESSALLERELESSLEQAERANKDLKLRNHRLQVENDVLKEDYAKLYACVEERRTQTETEKAQWRKREEDYVRYIRELEQKNDDFERSHRAMVESLGEIEAKLNLALEKNVLLESELDDKEALQVMVQRLKDETRDLKQEVTVREKQLTTGMPTDQLKGTVDSNKLADPQNQGYITSPMTPPNRISAMNIVGDLLRKVGTLENKLAQTRPSSQSRESTPSTPYRTRRLNRGTSTPSIHNLVKS